MRAHLVGPLVLLTACAHARDAGPLLAADRAFAAYAQAHGVSAAFVEYADEHATVLRSSGPELGKDAVARAFAGTDGLVLEWEPKGGELSGDGTVGWTWGTWRRWVRADPATVKTGRYLTTWRRDGQGRYHWSCDLGDEDR